MSTLDIGGNPLDTTDPAFFRRLAVAHLRHQRPRCLCVPGGVEMCVAKAGPRFILKRLPYSGPQHAAECRSHDAASVVTQAARPERRSPGPLLRMERSRCAAWALQAPALGVLLRSLWHRAELDRWLDAFEGRRSWATVRRRLYVAAEEPEFEAASKRLYIPEFFHVERRDAIRSRRVSLWKAIFERRVDQDAGLVLIGELKKILPAPLGYMAVIKHLPDQPFELGTGLYRFTTRAFRRELYLWTSSSEVRLILIASLDRLNASVPTMDALHLMAVTPRWLPARHEPVPARAARGSQQPSNTTE